MRMLGVIVACCLMTAAASAQHAPPPVEAYGRLPEVADAAISPDGAKIALATNINGEPSIVVYQLGGSVVFAAHVAAASQLRRVAWADDTHVAFLLTQAFAPEQILPGYVSYRGAPGRVDFSRWGIVDLSTRHMRLLSTSAKEDAWQDQGAALIAPIDGDPGFARLDGWGGEVETPHKAVYRIGFDNGRALPVPVQGANRDTKDFLFDAHAAVIARIDVNDASNRWSVFTYENGVPRALIDGISETGDPPTFPGLLGDGQIAEIVDGDDGFSRVDQIDVHTGARTTLSQHAGSDVDAALVDPWSRQVVGVSWIETEQKQEFYDASLQAAYTRILATFRGSARIVSWSRDRHEIVFYGETALDGGGYYTFDATSGVVTRISYCYPELAAAQEGQREALTYPARDGVRIPAYLTLPDGDPHNLPLVLLVHGGPGSRDTFDFDWWSSFLASRGYAVLQPNFRGSTGYGSAWEHAGYGQWGGLMQTDVEDGIAALARAGIIDQARVCIVGASYGGYAALAGAMLTPDRYKCAVSVAGLSDLPAFLLQRQWESGAQSAQSDYWRLSIGDRHDDNAHLRDISPVNLTQQVKAPILLLHGTNDTVVPIEQSRRMRDRLLASGKRVRYVELTGDDHWLSDATTRIQMLREIETFLAQNIGPAQAPPPTP